MKFGFCILHYRAEKDTEYCVNSILDLYGSRDVFIEIVDNCSPDGSGRRIEQLYENHPNIHVTLLTENVGFAKGNNAGIDWLKENFAPDFVIVVNNDTLFIQDDFLDVLAKSYEEHHFDVVGPDILDTTQTQHTSPLDRTLWSYETLKKQIKTDKIVYFFFKKPYREKLYFSLMNIKHKLFGVSDHPQEKTATDNKMLKNCVLQGSCMIFSRAYLNKHRSAFYPGTFLYCEEHILTYLVTKENGLVLYDPSLKIVHTGDKSTDEQMSNERAKKMFTMKHGIESRKILLKLMKQESVDF